MVIRTSSSGPFLFLPIKNILWIKRMSLRTTRLLFYFQFLLQHFKSCYGVLA